MKKLFYLIIFVLSFLVINDVHAASNYITLGDKIEDVKLYLKTDVFNKNTYMYEMKNKTTGEYVYCLEPGVMLYDGYYANASNTILSNDDWKYVNLIAYYGYGYQDRTELKWYIATQYMIWNYILRDKGKIYFVNEQNEKIDLYLEEMDAIEKDILHDQLLPSFALKDNYQINATSKLNESMTLIDTNYVLDEYNILVSYPEETDIIIHDNEITFTFHHNSINAIIFQRKMDNLGLVKVYTKNGSQTVFSRGVVSKNTGNYEVYVENPSLNLIKKGNGILSVSGAKYGIYDASSDFCFGTIITDEHGFAQMTDLYPGSYYLKEIEAPYGYLLNEEPVYFEIEDQDVTLEIEEKAIEKKIMIEKYLETKENLYIAEENAKFVVYNSSQEPIFEGTTNELGKLEFTLPYDTYKLVQIEGKTGFQLVEPITFTIHDFTNQEVFTIKNKEIVGNLTVTKKDKDTEEIILEEATFKIKNTLNSEYYEMNGTDLLKTKDGVLFIENIPYGDYVLEEVSAPDSYYLSNEKITFQIREMNEDIQLDFYNQKYSGSIEILKLDQETKEPLEGVLFGLYSENDECIRLSYTNELGIITFNHLAKGNYTIKEISTIEPYELITSPVHVSVKDHIKSLFTFYNRIEIDVPKTGVHEFFLGFIVSVFLLLIGVLLCNYEKN